MWNTEHTRNERIAPCYVYTDRYRTKSKIDDADTFSLKQIAEWNKRFTFGSSAPQRIDANMDRFTKDDMAKWNTDHTRRERIAPYYVYIDAERTTIADSGSFSLKQIADWNQLFARRC